MAGYAAIRGLASYLPPDVEVNGRDEESRRVAEALGIESRHVVQPGMSASDLAVGAAEEFFRRYPGSREQVDFMMLCTQFPDYYLPTTACLVAERLGMPKSVGALDYNLGCSGYVYGLAMAKGMVETGLARHLLLITSSLNAQFAAPTDTASRPLFGDGATVTLIEAVEAERPPLDAFVFGTDGKGYDGIIVRVGGSRHPFRHTPEHPLEGDPFGRTNYDGNMDGMKIMRFSLREVPPLVEEVLAKAGIKREDLDYCVFHQASKMILDFVQKKAGLMDVPFWNDAHLLGNTVASTIPLALEELLQQKSPQELRRVLFAGFGVGLSWAGCVADLGYML